MHKTHSTINRNPPPRQNQSTTMATIEIIKEALSALKDRTGSSVPAMNKWIESEKNVSSIRHVFVQFLRLWIFSGTTKTHIILPNFGCMPDTSMSISEPTIVQ